MQNLIAQTEIKIGGPFTGIGPLGEPGENAISVFAKVLSTFLGIITIIAGIWFVFLLITGAIGIMTAGSDKASLENARKRIISGLIGLVIIVAGIFVVDLVGKIIGINILNISELFELVKPKP